jgi:erythromycin esterase-like protein
MLTRILRAASQQRTVAREAAENAIQRVAELPGDGEMFARVKPLLAELDAKHPHLERLADLQGKQSEFIAAARQQVRDIVGLLNDVETELSGKATPDDCFLFGRCVRSIEMCLDTLDFDKGWRARDRHMAEHVSCICRRHPGERVVLTSGNWHIARVPIELSGMADYVTMGSLLAEKLGDKYRTLGSAFHGGRYLGVAGIGSSTEDIVVETHVPRPDTWEYFWNLHARDSAAPAPGFLVDFRAARSSDEESPWPPGLKMNIGEARASQPYEATFVSQRPDLQYDAMLFLIESTPLTVLPQYYLVSRQKWGAPSDS